jgi:hypothetical protein
VNENKDRMTSNISVTPLANGTRTRHVTLRVVG